MKKLILSGAAILAITSGAFAASHSEGEINEETVSAIMEVLEGMKCQMAPDDIEATDEGYELDDVICEGGNQFDIELDADLNETGRRAE